MTSEQIQNLYRALRADGATPIEALRYAYLIEEALKRENDRDEFCVSVLADIARLDEVAA